MKASNDTFLALFFYLPSKIEFSCQRIFMETLETAAKQRRYEGMLPKPEDLGVEFNKFIDEFPDIKVSTKKNGTFQIECPETFKVLIGKFIDKVSPSNLKALKELSKKILAHASAVGTQKEVKEVKKSDQVKDLIKDVKAGKADSASIVHFLALLHEILLENKM